MAPFYGWGLTASRLQPLRGDSLLFTIQFPQIPGNLKNMILNKDANTEHRIKGRSKKRR